jgi:antitoxin HigA-1
LKDKNMTMKNPPHPGEMIGDTLNELGISISAAARSLGVTRQQIHNVIAGRSVISPEMALRLEKGLGSSADTWLRMQLNYDLAQVRARTKSIKVDRLVAAA